MPDKNKSGVAEQILSLPKGGGALKGLGEKFQPDLHTGTGNFSIPIAVPPGRNGFQPQLSLNYTTGAGNGPFGLGWGLSIPNVSRKTSKGVPQYRDRFDAEGNPIAHPEDDTFILSGAEDLVHVGDGFYRPRTEGLFARIQRVQADDGEPCWIVVTKNGLRSIYGKGPESRLYVTENDVTKIFAWYLSETEDTFGNKIRYFYKRDTGADIDIRAHPAERAHVYNQLYLQRIEYVDYLPEGSADEVYLFHLEFDYGEYSEDGTLPNGAVWMLRPDPFSAYKAGFEVRTARRCHRILIKVGLNGPDQPYELIKSYNLAYDQAPYTNVSLLSSVTLTGHREGVEPESFPPLTFGYTAFEPAKRKYETIESMADYPPPQALSNTNYELIDLIGNGLPDIIQTSLTGYRYWRNLGNFRFAPPKSMRHTPFGVTLADGGVQFADMEGNGSADLLVTTGETRGYYANDFSGEWQRFHHWHQAPSFDLKDPRVKLVDVDGDGVMDVLATFPHHFLYIRNNNSGNGLTFAEPVPIERKHDLNFWPDVAFDAPDQRVRLADMTGDGLQDIVTIQDGRIDYWPSLGHGRWSRQIIMRNTPRLGRDFDPKRVFLTDVDGDGLADLVYVGFDRVHLWLNQGGNGWSERITVHGTPPTGPDSVRVADMKGTGTAGILWSYDYSFQHRRNYKYLDFTGGKKPYLLSEIDNHIGAVTKVEYRPSTDFYIADAEAGCPWKTTLPFPAQVVFQVEGIDAISKGKLTTEYKYHHGYWDGVEHEFLGFGMVEQLDSEIFDIYNQPGLHGEESTFTHVEDRQQFSPPTLTKTWLHQGPVGDEFGGWQEIDFNLEFWQDDPQWLSRPQPLTDFLAGLSHQVMRDALRALRGSILRTELYALDGTDRQDRPYTVTESLFGVREESPPGVDETNRLHIFFPHLLAQRTTQWERGDDPLTQVTFIDDYDDYGQPRQQTEVGLPRRATKRQDIVGAVVGSLPGDTVNETHILTTHTRTEYAFPDAGIYIYDRAAQVRTFELSTPPSVLESDSDNLASVLTEHAANASAVHQRFRDGLDNWSPGQPLPDEVHLIGHTLNHYDGQAFNGRPAGEVGPYGALTRAESLIFTDTGLERAYGNHRPTYLGDNAKLPNGAPAGFGSDLGFRLEHAGPAGYHNGYYADIRRQQFDFQLLNSNEHRGMVAATQDALEHQLDINYDQYRLYPIMVTDPVGMTTTAEYDYWVMQPSQVSDSNANATCFRYRPLGLLHKQFLQGRNGEGGSADQPELEFTYDFLAYERTRHQPEPQPIFVHTRRRVCHASDPDPRDEAIESREYSDGFGRLIQTRTQAEELVFGETGDDVGLGPDPGIDPAPAVGQRVPDRVVVSGWQVYDNKGRVIEKFEQFFARGWEYQPEDEARRGQHATLFYDPRGQLVCTVNPDGSKQKVIFGIPRDLNNPDDFSPTLWETYRYDANDLAPLSYQTLPDGSQRSLADHAPHTHHFTPTNSIRDALGRIICQVERNGSIPEQDWFITRSTHDLRGNLLTVVDALGRPAFQHAYDLVNRRLRVDNIDAGLHTSVLDAVGNLVEYRDSKGSMVLQEYDELDRLTRMWARNDPDAALTLRERLIYNDDPNEAGAREHNRLGRLFQHYDEAGLLQFDRYDFKGNLTEKTRRVVSDAALRDGWIANWEITGADGALDSTLYQTSSRYDALNRPITITYPQDVTGSRSLLTPHYNRAGALEQVELDGDPYVTQIAYNAKGQRVLIAYGNRIMTRYLYEPDTFRLRRLRTEMCQESAPTDDIWTGAGGLRQDFTYNYDLDGNILTLSDRAPDCGLPILPDRLDRAFTYDPLYRLLSATGRECDMPPPSPPWEDTPKCHDVTLTRGYSQEYTYDAVGNFLNLTHAAGANGSFTRTFELLPGNNRLNTVTIGATVYHYFYDNNGNLTRENTSRHYAWDHADRLASFTVQPENSPHASVEARYLYAADGMRVKKWVRTNGTGDGESTIYIDNLFEHYTDNDTDLSNNHLHVIDDKQRIALVRVGPQHPEDRGPAIQYHLGDHLGSSHVVVDDTGTRINREEFTPYGETSFGSFTRKRYRFTGKERDEESGLDYYGARYFAPWLERWVSCDPMGKVDGLNLYRYIRNNPIRFTDPFGLQPRPDALEIYVQQAQLYQRLGENSEILPEELRQRRTQQAGWAAGLLTVDKLVAAWKGNRLGWEPESEEGHALLGLGLRYHEGSWEAPLALESEYMNSPDYWRAFSAAFQRAEHGFMIMAETIEEGEPLKEALGIALQAILPMIQARALAAGMGRPPSGGGPPPSSGGRTPPGGSRRSQYIPRDPETGAPIPLPQQNVGGVDIPTPDPRAVGPHTTIGGRTSPRTGEVYLQTAEFPKGSWPTAGGQNVPWGRVDWSAHGRPSTHPDPHFHEFFYDWGQRRWVQGPGVRWRAFSYQRH